MKFLDVTLQQRKDPEPIEEKLTEAKYDWCYENSVNFGKVHLDVKSQEYKYNKWRTNGSLSNFLDTVFYANEMNMNYHITDQMHYDYLFHSIRKTKRFNKKKELDKRLEKLQKEEEQNLSLIQEYYKYNTAKSKAVLRVLTEAQLAIIRKRLEKGGVK
jgi:hypothetical protein